MLKGCLVTVVILAALFAAGLAGLMWLVSSAQPTWSTTSSDPTEWSATATASQRPSRPSTPGPSTSRPPTSRPPTSSPPPQPGFPAVTVANGPDPGLYRPPVSDNPVYDFGSIATSCGEVRTSTSVADTEARWLADVDCYAAGWVAVAGNEQYRVGVTTFSGSITTACGTSDWYAFYCGADRRMFVNAERIHAWELRDPTIHLATLAHEYAHHLQTVAGIRSGAYAADVEDWGHVQKRVELQATCFEVIQTKHRFSVAQFDRLMRGYVGDDSHGTTEHIQQWMLQGWNNSLQRSCNTWVVAAEHIE